MFKRFGVALLFCFCVGLSAQMASHAHRVIFVVTSPDHDDWSSAMVLADHYLAGIKPETAEVEVLAFGPGIDVLKSGAATATELAAAQKLGIHFVACENAMKTHHIAKAELLPGVTTVPSGVVDLVRKQEAGWSYVKVGR